MHRGVFAAPPQPDLVAGPLHRKPCSIKQRTVSRGFPGTKSTASRGLFKLATAFFSLIVGHSSQTLFAGKLTSLPSKRAVSASATISGVVGQPGSLSSIFTTSCNAYILSVNGDTPV